MPARTDPRTLAQVRQALNKKFGLGTIRDLETIEQVAVIPTGAVLVDHALGVGGFPRGRMVELYGEESSGKTTLALLAAAQCQKQGDAVLYMDYEHSFVGDYATLLGVSLDPDLFLLSQPEHLEQGFEILEAVLGAGGVGLAVVDSLAAMVPQKELEGDIGDVFVAVQARAMSQALRRFTPAVDRSQTCVVFVNHTRFLIGGFNPTGQERKTTPGGKALKFYASHRVELSRIKTIRGSVRDPISGTFVDGAAAIQFGVKVVKNKLAPPAKTGYFYLDAVRGHLDARAVLDVAAARGFVPVSGSRYTFGDTTVNGVVAASYFLNDHPDLFVALRRQVSEALAFENGARSDQHEQCEGEGSSGEARRRDSVAVVSNGSAKRRDSAALQSDSDALLGAAGAKPSAATSATGEPHQRSAATPRDGSVKRGAGNVQRGVSKAERSGGSAGRRRSDAKQRQGKAALRPSMASDSSDVRRPGEALRVHDGRGVLDIGADVVNESFE